MSTNQEYSWWTQEIQRGLAAQEKYGQSRDWDKWERYYLGEYRADLPMNYTFALARAMIPQVYFRNPKVIAMPRREDLQEQARVLSAVDNWVIQEMGLKPEIKRCILFAFLYGIGILKLGYDSEYGFKPEQVVGPITTPMGPMDLSDETVTDRDLSKRHAMEKIEYRSTIQRGMPWAMAIHPREFVLDPAALKVSEAQWTAHRVIRRLGDVKADVKYDKKGTRDLKPNVSTEFSTMDESRMIRADTLPPSSASPEQLRPQPTQEDDWVELWEIRDAKTEKIIVVNLDHDKFLRNEHDELQVDGLPFVDFRFNENPKTFWGVPDARVIHAQQLELNEIRKRQQEMRRQAKTRLMTRKGVIDADTKAKYLGEDPIAFIELEQEVQSVKDAVQIVQTTIAPDHMSWSENVLQDMREMIGMGRNQLGDFNRGAEGGQSRATATEANIVQQNSQIRVDERRDVVADCLQTVIRRVNQMIFKFWTSERYIRVSGQKGAFLVKPYTGGELKGEYDYEIEPDDALPMQRERKRQEAMTLYQLIMQNPAVDPVEALRQLISHFDGYDPTTLINPQALMMRQQMMAQAQGGQMEGAPGAQLQPGMPGMPQGG